MARLLGVLPTLGAEADKNWSEITSRNYAFDVNFRMYNVLVRRHTNRAAKAKKERAFFFSSVGNESVAKGGSEKNCEEPLLSGQEEKDIDAGGEIQCTCTVYIVSCIHYL